MHKQPDVATVLVTRVDGGVTLLRIITTSYGLNGVVNWTREATPERIEQVIRKHGWTDGLAPVSWRVVPNDIVNEETDNEYRDAWKDEGGKIGHDMPKAQDIFLTRLRRARTLKLEALDNDWMRAVGQGKSQDAAKIEGERQSLRDLPQTLKVENAKTVDELKALWPAGLPRV